MTDETISNVVPLHKRSPKTGAERARAYRARKRAAKAATSPVTLPATSHVTRVPITDGNLSQPAITIFRDLKGVFRNKSVAPLMLKASAFGLALVGITMNGWFARSLGSSDIAGWLFLAIGVAADLVALAIPSCAANLWASGQRGPAVAGWAVWAATFLFALTAGIGFASTNISDVTSARASRVTPAIAEAQKALTDAVGARDRECKDGVGKYCRVREDAVTARRQALDEASRTVEQAADPQTAAATQIVAWLSRGWIAPSSHDFDMLRLVLLALLPQVGGILLMVSRAGVSRTGR